MNDKTVVIHQPDFVPYLGFFHRLLNADAFVILDHVQMSKRGWVHRDKIKTEAGETWITVPVHGLGDQPIINRAEIDRNALYRKIPRMIEAAYRRAPFFDEIYPSVAATFDTNFSKLVDLNLAFLKLLLAWFAIDIPTFHSSALQVEARKSAMNAELVRKAGGTTYLSGVGARDYHEQEPFDALAIKVIWQDFTHPIYPQQFGDFVPYLSSLDVFLNCGIDGARNLLRETSKSNRS